MTAMTSALRSQSIRGFARSIDWAINRSTLLRLSALAALLLVVAAAASAVPSAVDAIMDAYLEIAVFVAFTLLLVYGAEAWFRTGLGALLLRHEAWQVPIGALLGAIPGCGGAIVAVTQFTRGHMSFGGVVATLTATMGDAMFVLIAAEPLTALTVTGVSLATGIAAGFLIDAIHGAAFLRPARPAGADSACQGAQPWTSGRERAVDWLWLGIMTAAMAIGIPASTAAIDLPAWVGLPDGTTEVIALGGAALGLLLWATDGDPDDQEAEPTACHGQRSIVTSVVTGTNFVLAWVVFAMVGYELLVAALAIDMAAWLGATGPAIVLIAILVGFVPGCGPQIVVASLYLSGAIPFSAQLGNAISNDGDALFPAIAVAPRAALVATLYSAVPAVLIGYGTYFFFE